MTKLIAALIVVGVLWCGWQLFFYWERVKNEQENEKKQAAAAAVVGEQLPGMPPQAQTQLENSLRIAKSQGAEALGRWLKLYGPSIQDPRKAWIQLDYCMALSQTAPAEARRVFIAVRDRTPTNSPVYPRVQKLQKTYQ